MNPIICVTRRGKPCKASAFYYYHEACWHVDATADVRRLAPADVARSTVCCECWLPLREARSVPR